MTEIRSDNNDPTRLFAMMKRWMPNKVLVIASAPAVLFSINVVAGLALFFLIEKVTGRASQLSAANYEKPYLIIEVIRHFGVFVTTSTVLFAAVLFRFGAFAAKWSDIEHGIAFRRFVIFLTLIIAWPFVTYGYNHFFDQTHWLDRFLLALLVPLIWWRPVFIFLFLVLVYALMGQLTEPALGGSILAHKTQVLKTLEIFAAAFLIHAITGYRKTDYFIYLVSCFVAAAYWVPAFAKLQLGWLGADQLHLIPLAAYAHGWLGFLQPSQVVVISEWLTWFDLPMRIAVIAIEAAFVLFLWHRRLSIGLLVAAIMFHLAVFALYGFFFWTWIALDAALLFLLKYYFERSSPRPYSLVQLVASSLVIGFGSLWANPPVLAWYETPVTYTYQIHAVTINGEEFPLHPRFFAPYEDVFTMVSFNYLVNDRAVLVGPYGVTHDRQIMEALFTAQTPADVFALENSTPHNRDNRHRRDNFYRFLVRFVGNKNHNGDRAMSLYSLHSPLQFWSQMEAERFLGSRQISELIVYQLTFFFDGQSLEVIRRQDLARVAIPYPNDRQAINRD